MADETTIPGAGSTSSQAARVSLDDFIETVTRSVMRAMNEGEVQGYALQRQPSSPQPSGGAGGPLPPSPWPHGPIIIGIIYNPQGGPFGGQGGAGELR